MTAAAIAGGDQKDVLKIWKMLSGSYEPEKIETDEEKLKRAALAKEQIKGAFGISH